MKVNVVNIVIRNSMLTMSVARRLMGAMLMVAFLWIAVFYALSEKL